ncbi:MAG TPA: DUF4245 family protein, partial [Mycobacteriales bacterium]|nr:DUF4245 family protein [Mycobacteriales bacterium]
MSPTKPSADPAVAAPVEPAAPRRNKRGRESTADMVRSLALVLVPVVVLWFFAQPGPDAERTIRPVDQSGDVEAWQSTASPGPVPTAPQAWVPTVSQQLTQPYGLRLGWNTDGGRYAEFAATTAKNAAKKAGETASTAAEKTPGTADKAAKKTAGAARTAERAAAKAVKKTA